MSIDFLIIGQGLAGSLLAWELMQRGCSVTVIDHGKENASQVAAGLINPVTGLRLVKSAEVDTLLPAAKYCYRQLATFFRQDFYIEKTMLRVLRSEADYRQAQKRLHDDAYLAYLHKLHVPDACPYPFATPFGVLEQQQTGYLLTRPLLHCLRDFFIANSCYRQAEFHADALALAPKPHWQDLSPGRIVFCEGYQALHNPWFSGLPFQPAKGEILTLAHQHEVPDKLLNYGNWLIPTLAQQSRMGATFSHDTLDTRPTAFGKGQLMAALAEFAPDLAQAEVIAHHANIRPCTVDKQPFVGFHPRQPQVAIFNGFGAKGSLQIPWYSQRFADTLIDNSPPPSPIARYYATHFPT